MIVGIDLGTTNSLLGVIENGRPRLVVGEDGSPLIPSVVNFPEQGGPIVGSGAKSLRASRPKTTVSSVKRLMGKGISDLVTQTVLDYSSSDEKNIRIKIRDRSITPIEISSLILRKLKNLAEAQLGVLVSKAVITVPAYFNDSQRQATRLAGEMAGLEMVRMVNEPTAACLAYGLNQKAQGTIAVYDLGGGTFDISILAVKDGVFEVLATNGDTQLGGDDFDEAIAKGIDEEMVRDLQISALNGSDRTSFLIAAEKLKRELTQSAKACFSFRVGSKEFARSYSREDLKVWADPILERTRIPVLNCLMDTHRKIGQITDVILVGGSTRSPVVSGFVRELFQREPISSLNPDEVVAVGAAIQARVLEGKIQGMLLLDVTPLSLGIETIGGLTEKIIHRNATIPVSASQIFTTSVDGQTSVEIHVVQGERELVSDNRSLARFRLGGVPPMLAGLPKIEVEFVVDANGILSVRAMELRSARTALVTVKPTYGLTDADVEAQLLASFDNAERDFESRFLIQACNDADALLRATEKTLRGGAHLLTGDEQHGIRLAIGELKSVLGNRNYKVIQSAIERLNQSTEKFAQRYLDYSVTEALKHKPISGE